MKNFRYKKHMRITAGVLLLTLSLSLVHLLSSIWSKDRINLYIDGRPVKFNIEPIERKNHIYLPLLEVMEALGYKTQVDSETYSLDFQNRERMINHRLGRTYGYVNNKFTHFSRPTLFKDGHVFASLETIKKMTSTYSNWTGDSPSLYLESPPKIHFLERDDQVHISSYNKQHQILGQIKGSQLSISGHIEKGLAWTMDSLTSYKKINLDRDLILDNKFKTSQDLIKINKLNKLVVNAKREDSNFDHPTYMKVVPKYDLEVFSLDRVDHEKIYNSKIDQYVFARPENYNENLVKYNEHSLNHPKNFLSLDFIKDPDQLDEIRALALYITQGIDRDYDKVFAIHNWLVENLAYDYEKYYSQDWSGQDAYLTLEEKKSLCEGFSFLNMALCRSLNLPSKLVFGFAGNPDLTRAELEHTRYGHAWNEVFVDNRWIIVDPTWNTKNTYNSGFFLKNTNSFLFFDISLKQMSNTHLIELYPIY